MEMAHSNEQVATRFRPVSHAPSVIEWDVYLDLAVAKRVDGLMAGQLSTSEVSKLAAALVDSVVISHGSLWHIFIERALGISMHASIMQRSHGMTVHNWLRSYFHALASVAPEVNIHAVSGHSVTNAVPYLSVFLDVKSAGASARVLDLLTQGLNDMGVHVHGVGSFVHSQMSVLRTRVRPQVVSVPALGRRTDGSPPFSDAISAGFWELDSALGHTPIRHTAAPAHGASSWAEVDPSIAAEGTLSQRDLESPSPSKPWFEQLTFAPPVAFHIFSFFGEIQRACDGGKVPRGSHILFNGGTMIEHDSRLTDPDAISASYHIDPRVLADLDRYRRTHDLHFGYYTQEPLLDAAAADLLVRTSNDNLALFEHGFAYSGLPGHAASDIKARHGAPAVGWHVPWWLRWLVRRWRVEPLPAVPQR